MAAIGAQLTLSESRLSDGFAPKAVLAEANKSRLARKSASAERPL
jgi:hypothetical protein